MKKGRQLAMYCRLIGAMSLLVSALSVLAHAEPIRVRYPQGSAHGFLALKTLDGSTIATGEVTQTVRGDEVTSRLVFRFRDGSRDEDLTVFTQRHTFRLVSDHHIQHGPSFPKPIDVLIDGVTGQITSRAEDGKVKGEHLELPPDVSNGLPPNLLLNLLPSTPETNIRMLLQAPNLGWSTSRSNRRGALSLRLAGCGERLPTSRSMLSWVE